MNEGTQKSIPYSSGTGSTGVGTSKRNSSSTLLDSHRCRKRFRLMQDAFRSLSFGDSTATTNTSDAGATISPSGTTALKDTNQNGLARKNNTSSIFISNTKRRGSLDQITYLDPNRDGHTIFDLEDDDSFLDEEEVGSTAICNNNLNCIEPRISELSTTTTTTTTPLPGDYKEIRTSYGGLLSTEDDEDDSVGSKASQEQSAQPVTILPPILQKERKQKFLSAVDTKIEDIIRKSRLQAALQQQQQQQQQPQRHKLLNHQGKLVSTFSQDDFCLQSSLPPPLRFLPRQRSNSFSDFSNDNDAEEMMMLD
jgi:hypothetical protein